jgi:hypothetical protein
MSVPQFPGSASHRPPAVAEPMPAERAAEWFLPRTTILPLIRAIGAVNGRRRLGIVARLLLVVVTTYDVVMRYVFRITFVLGLSIPIDSGELVGTSETAS